MIALVMMRFRKSGFCIVTTLSVLLFLSLVSSAQEDAEFTEQTTQIVAYFCEYNPVDLSFSISFSVLGSDKRPIRDTTYTISEGRNVVTGVGEYTLGVVNSDNQPLAIKSLENRFSNRNPIRLLILPDVTNTVPVEGLKNPLRNFITRLLPEDEVAIMPFGSSYSVSDIDFSEDQDLDDVVENLSPQSGDNDLWGAVEDALRAFSPSYTRRQILIVLTDSRHPNADDAIDFIDDELTPILAESDIQVFVIGFQTTDQPSLEEVSRLAVRGNGTYWYIDEPLITPEQLENELENLLLTDVTDAIDAEMLLRVDASVMPSQPEDEFISLTVRLMDSEGNITASNGISCPYDSQDYTITFENLDNGQIITSALDVNVRADPVMPPNGSVVFRLDNSSVQSSEFNVLQLDPTEILPGSYSLSAILFRDGSELDRTEQVSIELHSPLSLTAENDPNTDGTIQLTAQFSNAVTFDLENRIVVFEIESNQGERELIDQAMFNNNGVANLQWSSNNYAEQNQFTEDQAISIVSYVEGLEDYTVTPVPLRITVKAIETDLTVLAWALGLSLSIPLIVLNWMVLRHIDKARVDKLIRIAPNELPRQYADTVIGRLTYNDDNTIAIPVNQSINRISRASNQEHHGTWLSIPTERVPRDRKQGQPTISRQGDSAVVYSGNNWYFVKLLNTQQKYVVGKKKITKVKAVKIELGTPIYIENIGTLVIVKSSDSRVMDTTAYA